MAQKMEQQILVLPSFFDRLRRRKKYDLFDALSSGPPYYCPFSQCVISERAAQALLRVMNMDEFAPFFSTTAGITDLDHALRVMSFMIAAPPVEEGVAAALNEFPIGRVIAAIWMSRSPVPSLAALANDGRHDVLFSLFLPMVRQLQKLVRYNDLRDMMNFYSGWFNTHGKGIEPQRALAFLNEFNASMRLLNGRVIEIAPSYDFRHVPHSCRLYRRLLIAQARSLSMNLEYALLETLLTSAYVGTGAQWLKICEVLGENPARSERDSIRRQQLRKSAGDNALRLLDKKYRGGINRVANRMLYYAAIDQEDEIARVVEEFLARFPAESKGDTRLLEKLRILFARLPAAVLVFRARSLYGVFYRLVKSRKLGVARKWLDFASPLLRKKIYDIGLFAIMHATADYAGVSGIIEQRQALPAGKAARSVYAQCLRAQGRFTDALRVISDKRIIKSNNVENIFKEASKLVFLDKTSAVINAVPQPSAPAGVVLISSLNCYNSLAIMAPSLVELKKQGYAVIHLTAGMMDNQKTGIDDIDRFAGSVTSALHDGQVLLNWKVDWPNRVVECQGINFYQGVYERLSISHRRFSIDITDPLFERQFAQIIKTCDYLLRACLDVHAALVMKGVPVVMISGNTHVMPCAIFRDFCFAQGSGDLRFVAVNIAYENYYNNLGKKFSGSMSVVDMTKHRTCRMPFLALPERFEGWYAANRDDEKVRQKARELIYTNRSLTDEKRSSPVTRRIEVARAEGRKVICCFGKILCDLAVPYDGGPAHRDIGDWINHTIDVLAGRTDVLLLIKPHPHELRPEIALDLVEHLRDILPQMLPDNVIFLDHNEYNLSDMAGFLDLAILWNGTSSLELTAMDVPVMMCSSFGRHDYPVTLIYPQSRDQYRDYLHAGAFMKPSDELKNKAMALLHYMGTTDVALPNLYTKRSVTNDYTGFPVWNEELVSSFVKEGDLYMKIAAGRIVEGIETEDTKRRQYV